MVVQRWVQQYYHGVAAMYEDRMDLFGLGRGASLQVMVVQCGLGRGWGEGEEEVGQLGSGPHTASKVEAGHAVRLLL